MTDYTDEDRAKALALLNVWLPREGGWSPYDRVTVEFAAFRAEARRERDAEIGEVFGVPELSGSDLLDYLAEQARLQGDLVRQRDSVEQSERERAERIVEEHLIPNPTTSAHDAGWNMACGEVLRRLRERDK